MPITRPAWLTPKVALPLTQQERIYQALKRAGSKGANNYELSHISLRYGACIFELRRGGETITTKLVNKKKGLYIYRLEK